MAQTLGKLGKRKITRKEEKNKDDKHYTNSYMVASLQKSNYITVLIVNHMYNTYTIVIWSSFYVQHQDTSDHTGTQSFFSKHLDTFTDNFKNVKSVDLHES